MQVGVSDSSSVKVPSKSPVQRNEYLFYGGQIGKHNGSFSDSIPLQKMPVSSAIMSLRMRDIILQEGKIGVKGWAYSGGGRRPEQVEVSPDRGCNWYAVPPEKLSPKQRFAFGASNCRSIVRLGLSINVAVWTMQSIRSRQTSVPSGTGVAIS